MTPTQERLQWLYVCDLANSHNARIVDSDGFTICDIHTPNDDAAAVADRICRDHNALAKGA